MILDLFEVIKKRRSIRIFQPLSVPEAVIEKAIDAALMAPNTSNIQPWEFYWVKSEEKKQQLIRACLNQLAARNAEELVVAVARIDFWKRNSKLIIQILESQSDISPTAVNYYKKLLPIVYTLGPFGILGFFKFVIKKITSFFGVAPDVICSRSELFKIFVKSTALACENFILAIVAQGYGCCSMEGFDSSKIKKILGLNRNSDIVMVIAIGTPDPKGTNGPQLRLKKELFYHVIR